MLGTAIRFRALLFLSRSDLDECMYEVVVELIGGIEIWVYESWEEMIEDLSKYKENIRSVEIEKVK